MQPVDSVPAADVLPPKRVLFAWQERIRDDVELPTPAKATAWALGTRMDLYGRDAYPSLTTLARDVGCDRRTVMRHLNVLEERGYIIRQRPKRQGPNHFTSYVAAVPDGDREDPTDDRDPDDTRDASVSINRDEGDPSNAEIGTGATPDRDRGDPLTPPVAPPLKEPATQEKTQGDDEEADDDVEHDDGGGALVPCPHCHTPVAPGDDCTWCGEALDWTQRLALSMPGVQVKAVAS